MDNTRKWKHLYPLWSSISYMIRCDFIWTWPGVLQWSAWNGSTRAVVICSSIIQDIYYLHFFCGIWQHVENNQGVACIIYTQSCWMLIRTFNKCITDKWSEYLRNKLPFWNNPESDSSSHTWLDTDCKLQPEICTV